MPQHLYKFTIVHSQILSAVSEIRYIFVHYDEGSLYIFKPDSTLYYTLS
jgi:hypothetical protein